MSETWKDAVIAIPEDYDNDGRERCTSLSHLPGGGAIQCTLLEDHPDKHMFVVEWDEPTGTQACWNAGHRLYKRDGKWACVECHTKP